MQVIFHLAYEGYKYSEKRQLDDMDLTTTFDQYVHRMRASEEDDVQFTTFQRVIINESENFDNVNTPILTYFTMWRSMGSYVAPTYLPNWGYSVIGDLDRPIPPTPEPGGIPYTIPNSIP